jgi:hypothetical protein
LPIPSFLQQEADCGHADDCFYQQEVEHLVILLIIWALFLVIFWEEVEEEGSVDVRTILLHFLILPESPRTSCWALIRWGRRSLVEGLGYWGGHWVCPCSPSNKIIIECLNIIDRYAESLWINQIWPKRM